MKTTAVTRASLIAALGMSALAMAPSGQGASRLTQEATQATAKAQQGERAPAMPGDTKANRLNSQWARTTRGARRAGYGWTNAHAKRVARKARNVKRHRAAGKGKA